NAYTTDTMHRVTVNTEYSIEAFIASYYNSLSFALAEVCGRSHGGGVLELMPNEAEEILLPYHTENENLLPEIDKRIRRGECMQSILDYTNDIILAKNFGLTREEISLSNKIWVKLRD